MRKFRACRADASTLLRRLQLIKSSMTAPRLGAFTPYLYALRRPDIMRNGGGMNIRKPLDRCYMLPLISDVQCFVCAARSPLSQYHVPSCGASRETTVRCTRPASPADCFAWSKWKCSTKRLNIACLAVGPNGPDILSSCRNESPHCECICKGRVLLSCLHGGSGFLAARFAHVQKSSRRQGLGCTAHSSIGVSPASTMFNNDRKASHCGSYCWSKYCFCWCRGGFSNVAAAVWS